MHKHLQSPYDAQTSALNQTLHAVDAIPNLTVRGTSSLTYPIKDLLSVEQLFQQQEVKWYQRYQGHDKALQDRFISDHRNAKRSGLNGVRKIKKLWRNQLKSSALLLSAHLRFSYYFQLIYRGLFYMEKLKG